MKKYILVILITSMCGGSNSNLDTQTEITIPPTSQEQNNSTPIPPVPEVDFNIIEIYNTKLGSELCSDVLELDTTSQDCLLTYRDNLEFVFGFSERLEDYLYDLNEYFAQYPSEFNEEYESLFEFISSKFSKVPENYGKVSAKYQERFESSFANNSPFIDDEIIRVFASSDLTDKTINTTVKYTLEAYELWMGPEYYGKSQARSIYLMITGSNLEAGRVANQEYCSFLGDLNYQAAEWCRPDTSDNYVENGGAGINSSGPVEGFYFMVMAPKGNNLNQGYKTMTYHEVFHIYQMSNIFSRDYEEVDLKSGRKSGDDPNSDVAWWSEGNADFFAALYSYDLNEFKNEMRWALEGNGPFTESRKSKFFNNGQRLYNISWSQGDTVDLAYRIGSWFTAYLVHNHGEQAVYDFWESVDSDSFENTFISVFSKDHKSYIHEFEEWLQKPNLELYEILDSIYSSKVK